MHPFYRIAAGACALAQAACAASPSSIDARYVSPVTYQGWNCDQLVGEKARLSSEVTRVSDLQSENAAGDAVMVTAGVVLFLPILIGLAATKDRKEELGRLKGEYEAVDLVTNQKNCTGVPSLTPATVEASAPLSSDPAAPVPTPPPVVVPAYIPPPPDPNEVILCNERGTVLTRTRALCSTNGGLPA